MLSWSFQNAIRLKLRCFVLVLTYHSDSDSSSYYYSTTIPLKDNSSAQCSYSMIIAGERWS